MKPLYSGRDRVSRRPLGLLRDGLPDGRGPGVQLLGVDGAVELPQHRGVPLDAAGQVGVDVGIEPLEDAHGPLVEPLGLLVLLLPGQDARQLVDRCRRLHVGRADRLLLDLERPPQQGLGLVEVGLRDVDQRQRVQVLEYRLVVRLRMGFADAQGPSGQRLGVGVSPLVIEHPGQVRVAPRQQPLVLLRVGADFLDRQPELLLRASVPALVEGPPSVVVEVGPVPQDIGRDIVRPGCSPLPRPSRSSRSATRESWVCVSWRAPASISDRSDRDLVGSNDIGDQVAVQTSGGASRGEDIVEDEMNRRPRKGDGEIAEGRDVGVDWRDRHRDEAGAGTGCYHRGDLSSVLRRGGSLAWRPSRCRPRSPSGRCSTGSTTGSARRRTGGRPWSS